ncbi:MAG: putative nicotinate phosphoribosyltransferase [Acidimicrobiales bacterium]|jgi:nicotinate phosphoribosyltransferase|nr:putative nicotinate phosphoribosyltransferase [Acidimicrobiales bacterium]
MPGALLTDFYELTMLTAYLRRGMTQPATFSLFARSLPPARGYLVVAGVESALAALEALSFDDADLAWCRDALDLDDATTTALAELRFTGEVWAVPEGRMVLAGEPWLEVTSALPESQLVETLLLNRLTFPTAVASKAARCIEAARGRPLADFAMRRTPSLDAADAVARATALVGFASTSNVDAARRHHLPTTGTMAHSFVQAFASEAETFAAYAEDFPERPTFLVDTYDTERGVRAAIAVIREKGLGDVAAIRLDSGDLGALARMARALLDDAGLPAVRIVASGGLDEHKIDALVRGGAPIDAFGVGSQLGTVADAPVIDTIYKLVDLAGRPIAKQSTGKATWPGAKQVVRAGGGHDLLALRDEPVPAGGEPLLVPVMRGGRRLDDRPDPSLAAARRRFEADRDWLPAAARRLRDPVAPEVRITDALATLTESVRS